VDSGDDLGVVDPAQLPGADREVSMPELPLDHEQRDPLARHAANSEQIGAIVPTITGIAEQPAVLMRGIL
jgi:hypothetical protein